MFDYFKSKTQMENVIIFGSRACGNFKDNSDIDLALIGNIDNHFLFKIAFDLDSLSLIYKFDVLNYNNISNEKLLSEDRTKSKVFYERSGIDKISK